MQNPQAVSRFEGARQFDPQPQYLVANQGAVAANASIKGAPPMVFQDEVEMSGGSFTHLQHPNDIEVPGKSAHRALFAQEPFPVVVEFRGENLHRHCAVQTGLSTAVDDSKTAAPDFFGTFESGSA